MADEPEIGGRRPPPQAPGRRRTSTRAGAGPRAAGSRQRPRAAAAGGRAPPPGGSYAPAPQPRATPPQPPDNNAAVAGIVLSLVSRRAAAASRAGSSSLVSRRLLDRGDRARPQGRRATVDAGETPRAQATSAQVGFWIGIGGARAGRASRPAGSRRDRDRRPTTSSRTSRASSTIPDAIAAAVASGCAGALVTGAARYPRRSMANPYIKQYLMTAGPDAAARRRSRRRWRSRCSTTARRPSSTVYARVLRRLKHVFDTENEVLVLRRLAARGAMESAVGQPRPARRAGAGRLVRQVRRALGRAVRRLRRRDRPLGDRVGPAGRPRRARPRAGARTRTSRSSSPRSPRPPPASSTTSASSPRSPTATAR